MSWSKFCAAQAEVSMFSWVCTGSSEDSMGYGVGVVGMQYGFDVGEVSKAGREEGRP